MSDLKSGKSGSRRPVPRNESVAEAGSRESSSNENLSPNAPNANTPRMKSGPFSARTGKPLQRVVHSSEDTSPRSSGTTARPTRVLASASRTKAYDSRSFSAAMLDSAVSDKKIRSKKTQNTSDARGTVSERKRLTFSSETMVKLLDTDRDDSERFSDFSSRSSRLVSLEADGSETCAELSLVDLESTSTDEGAPVLSKATALQKAKECLEALPLEEQARYAILLVQFKAGRIGIQAAQHIKSEELRKLFWATQDEAHFVHLVHEDKLGEVHRHHSEALKKQYGDGNVLQHADPRQILSGVLLGQYESLFGQPGIPHAVDGKDLTGDDKARLWEFSQRLAIHVIRTLDAARKPAREAAGSHRTTLAHFISVLGGAPAGTKLERSFLRLAESIKQEIAARDARKGAVVEDFVKQAMRALLERRVSEA